MKITPQLLEMVTKKFPKISPRAACVAEFIQTYCTLSKGAAGAESKRFILEDWQLEILDGIYPGLPGDPRIITRALISMARKNGKTELCSALIVVHLLGPEYRKFGEIICAAAGRQEQAAEVFKGAKRMCESHPALRKHFDTRHNRLLFVPNGRGDPLALVRTISTSVASAQGMLPSLWVFDEFAQAKDRGLYTSLDYSQSQKGIDKGLGLLISTRSTIPNSLFDQLYKECMVGRQNGEMLNWFFKVYSADPTIDDPFTEEQLRAANPGMGTLIDEEELLEELKQAQRHDHKKADFRAYRLNIASGSATGLIDPASWRKAGVELEPRDDVFARLAGQRVVLGIDLGATLSMTAIALWFPDSKFFMAVNFMAESQVAANEQKYGFKYSVWAEQGRLVTVGKDADGGMDYGQIADFVIECLDRFEVMEIRYDKYGTNRLFQLMADRGYHHEHWPLVDKLSMFAQTIEQFTPAIVEFEDMIVNGQFRHDNDPVTNSAVMCCQVKRADGISKGARKPEKDVQGNPNDAAVAMLMALSNRGLYIDKGPDGLGVIKEWYTRQGAASQTADASPDEATGNRSAVTNWLLEQRDRW